MEQIFLLVTKEFLWQDFAASQKWQRAKCSEKKKSFQDARAYHLQPNLTQNLNLTQTYQTASAYVLFLLDKKASGREQC